MKDINFVEFFTKILGKLDPNLKDFLAYAEHYAGLSYNPDTNEAISILMATAVRNSGKVNINKGLIRHAFEMGGKEAIDFAKFITFRIGDLSFGEQKTEYDFEFNIDLSILPKETK